MPNTINAMAVMIILEGKNCLIKNLFNCKGEAPNVSNSSISVLQDEMVN